MTEALNRQQKALLKKWESLPEEIRPSRESVDARIAALASITGTTPKGKITENNAAKMREARVILDHLEMRTQIVERPCKQCGRQFATDYLFAAYCGDLCLAASLEEKYNFKWNPAKTPEERWGFEFEPPSIVKPETLAKLKDWARRILDLPTVESYRGLDVESKVPNIATYGGPDTWGIKIPGLPPPPKQNKFSSF